MSAVILYDEYVRLVSEAWYSHKLFIWSNLVFHTTHLAVFWDLHAKKLALMTLAKCMCLLLITIAQFMTKPQTSNNSINSHSDNKVEIRRSTSVVDDHNDF